MITANGLLYRAFGLRVASEFGLPELAIDAETDKEADVSVRIADLSDEWARVGNDKGKFVVDRGRMLFRVREAAVFCVEGGVRITVSPLPGASEDKIRLYLLGTCFGALLLQRSVLPLHGSAVVIGGKAYAFVGESGAGKSTLAAALTGLGYPLVSDDVIAVSPDEGRTPMVTPSYPQQKLWDESLQGLGIERNGFRPIFERETKFSVPAAGRFHAEPLPLGGVFELTKGEGERHEISPVRGLERLPLLFAHTYRNTLLGRMDLMNWHLRATSNLAGRVGIYRLRRSAAGFTAGELASLVLTTIREEGTVR